MTQTVGSNGTAHFDAGINGVVIDGLTVRDKDVVREAQRWTAGERGPVVDDQAVLAQADLAEFVTKALTVGSHALSATGQAQEAQAIERMIAELGDKASQSTADAAAATGTAVKNATDAVAKAAADAQQAFREADAVTRKSLTESIAAARRSMEDELKRMFGGTEPEVVARFAPLLEKFATDLQEKASSSTNELLAKAARQFDPSDPTSPMAKHTAELTSRQAQLTERMDKQHSEIATKLGEIVNAIKVEEAKAAIAGVTPIKGVTYEAQVNEVLTTFATAMGAEYSDTGAVTGVIPRSKKGDGVLSIDDGAVRIVFEMTDSNRSGWQDYLAEAERNRQASASLALVRTTNQNSGEIIRVIGKRRIVLAYDPATDEPDLLRAVVQLLRAAATTAATRAGTEGIATAEEKIEEAIEELGKIADIKKAAEVIGKQAVKVERTGSAVSVGIERLLGEALAALGTVAEADDPTADETRRAA